MIVKVVLGHTRMPHGPFISRLSSGTYRGMSGYIPFTRRRRFWVIGWR